MEEKVKEYLKDLVGVIDIHILTTYTFHLKDITYDEIKETYVFLYEITNPTVVMLDIFRWLIEGSVKPRLRTYRMEIPFYVETSVIKK